MPARVQRQDAKIFAAATSPPAILSGRLITRSSRHFLDCCDELGLLVLEEIPGWQHIGDEAWQQLAIDNGGG